MSDAVSDRTQGTDESRTATSADALRRGISDHLLYSLARPAALLEPKHYYRALALAVRDRMQQRWMATTQDWLDQSAKVAVLPVGGVPDGPAAGQQPAQPGHRGRGPRRAGRAGPGPRRDPGLRGGAGPGQRRPGPAGRLLPGLAGHPGAPRRSATASATSSASSTRRSTTAGRSRRPTTGWCDGNPWEIDKPDASYIVNWGGHTEQYEDLAGHHRVRWIPAAGRSRASPTTPRSRATASTPATR